jgi:hypothetical protein
MDIRGTCTDFSFGNAPGFAVDQIHTAVAVVIHALDGDGSERRGRGLRDGTVRLVDVATHIRGGVGVEVYVRRIRRGCDHEPRAKPGLGAVTVQDAVCAVTVCRDEESDVITLLAREGEDALGGEGDRVACGSTSTVRVQNNDAARNDVRE